MRDRDHSDATRGRRASKAARAGSGVTRLRRGPGLKLLAARLRHHRFPPHLHDEYVIGINEYGEESFLCRGKVWRASPLELQLINPGEVHTGATTTPVQAYRAIYLEPQVVRSLFGTGRAAPWFKSPLRDDAEMAGRLLDAHRALMRDEDDAAAHAQLIETLGELLGRHAAAREDECRAELRPEVASTRDHICAHYARRLGLDALAERVSLSPHHLLRLFRDQIGVPPHRFLLQVRIEKAQELLETGAPLVDVALAVGFCHQSHFTEHFRRLVGVTPGCYSQGMTATS